MKRERILLSVSAHNGLSQRAGVALAGSDAELQARVAEHQPGLIVCPFLTRMIPESIWSRLRCLILHPGPVGDRGPSSLDWAIELGARVWGVTVLEADGEFGAGRVWATREFPIRNMGKSSIYRPEEATMRDTLEIPRAPAPAGIVGREAGPRPRSADADAAPSRAAIRYYEQHVIAWHALGRVTEARAARDAIARHREKQW